MAFRLMLAPMEKIALAPLRTRCYQQGADLTFCEMARVSNLARAKRGELDKIQILDGTPTQIQLAGSKLAEYEKFLSQFKPPPGFAGFNLNLGCPSPGFMRQGLGAAMIKRVKRTNEIGRLIQAAGYACSIKMRLGMNRYERERGAYLNLIQNVEASFFVVHARSADQSEEDPLDEKAWEACLGTGKPIVANGDIRTPDQVVRLREQGFAGAMIGRAAIGHPELFAQMRRALEGGKESGSPPSVPRGGAEGGRDWRPSGVESAPGRMRGA